MTDTISDKRDELLDWLKKLAASDSEGSDDVALSRAESIMKHVDIYAQALAEERLIKLRKDIDKLEVEHTVQFGDVLRWSDVVAALQPDREETK